jgi:hypothetical protein
MDCLALSFLDALQRPGQSCQEIDHRLALLSSLFNTAQLLDLVMADNRGPGALIATAEIMLVRMGLRLPGWCSCSRLCP